MWICLKQCLHVFYHGLNVEYEKKKAVKDDVKGFRLKNCEYQWHLLRRGRLKGDHI